MSQPLNLKDFYYEDIRREFVNDILLCAEDGDFIVRNPSLGKVLVISVSWKGKICHFQPNFDGKLFSFGNRGFPTIIELISYHLSNKVPLSGATQAIIKKPVCRGKTTYSVNDIEILSKLGEGNFGEVFRVNIRSENKMAAMKTLRSNVSKEIRDTFIKEFDMMNTMKHENVVQCLGIVDDGDRSNMKILLELVNKGSLDKLLRESKLTKRGKSRILLDVARGLHYLHNRTIIHRDLAARNILVQRNKDGSIIGKVSDFGLSQPDVSGSGYNLKKSEILPLKWLAPECLVEKKWTAASDVWSFGVLMWEVWTDGADPYSENEEIVDSKTLKQFIARGGHPIIPETVPEEFAAIMLSCWTADHNKRPTMEKILGNLENAHRKIKKSGNE